MKAVIEFTFSDYAQVDDSSTFSLALYEDDGTKVFDDIIGHVRFPRDIIDYVGEDLIKLPNIYRALCDAEVKNTEYWEE